MVGSMLNMTNLDQHNRMQEHKTIAGIIMPYLHIYKGILENYTANLIEYNLWEKNVVLRTLHP